MCLVATCLDPMTQVVNRIEPEANSPPSVRVPVSASNWRISSVESKSTRSFTDLYLAQKPTALVMSFQKNAVMNWHRLPVIRQANRNLPDLTGATDSSEEHRTYFPPGAQFPASVDLHDPMFQLVCIVVSSCQRHQSGEIKRSLRTSITWRKPHPPDVVLIPSILAGGRFDLEKSNFNWTDPNASIERNRYVCRVVADRIDVDSIPVGDHREESFFQPHPHKETLRRDRRTWYSDMPITAWPRSRWTEQILPTQQGTGPAPRHPAAAGRWRGTPWVCRSRSAHRPP